MDGRRGLLLSGLGRRGRLMPGARPGPRASLAKRPDERSSRERVESARGTWVDSVRTRSPGRAARSPLPLRAAPGKARAGFPLARAEGRRPPCARSQACARLVGLCVGGRGGRSCLFSPRPAADAGRSASSRALVRVLLASARAVDNVGLVQAFSELSDALALDGEGQVSTRGARNPSARAWRSKGSRPRSRPGGGGRGLAGGACAPRRPAVYQLARHRSAASRWRIPSPVAAGGEHAHLIAAWPPARGLERRRDSNPART